MHDPFEIGIYIHIPFCERKCLYCDFVSYEIKENQVVDSYFERLNDEIEAYKSKLHGFVAKSIFFGGGTPSSVDGKYISKTLKSLKEVIPFKEDIEITLEANPGTLSEAKINQYLSSGINRISLGLQTTDSRLLKDIGRIHNLNDFMTSYDALRDKGFKNISVDLMFGLPNQTMDQLQRTLDFLIRIGPEHISAYALKIEEGTPMYELNRRGALNMPDEDTERDMYHLIQAMLSKHGYNQYEISNFSKPGYESRHNLVYWENTPYIGLGVSAHSKFENIRYHNAMTLMDYLQANDANSQYKIIKGDAEYIGPDEDLFETIMLGLRLNKGIDYGIINQRYHLDFLNKYQVEVEKLINQALIEVDLSKNNIKLTPLGMDLSNQVFLAFMPED